MPLYDFKCDECGHAFEQLVKSDATVGCPQCSGVATKQISAPGKPVFKGSGFYETDFKGKQ